MMIGVADLARSSRHRLSPSSPGQHEVEDHEIDARVRKERRASRASVAVVDAIAMLGQEPRQQIADLAIIIDDEQVGEISIRGRRV